MRLLSLALLLAAATAAHAQSLEEKYKKKLEAPFLKKAAWVTDFDAARKRAADENKLIFTYFTRSFAP